MTTEEQIQSSDFERINGTEDTNTYEHDNETTSDTSSAPLPRRSRFFRSKRKQRLNEEQSSNDDSLNDTTDSPKTPQQSTEETTVDESSTTDTDSPAKQTLKKRPTSPPPPPVASTDETSELDTTSSSEEINFSSHIHDSSSEHQNYLAKHNAHEKQSSNQPRPSLPTIYSGYQRKKSQSVKLTRIDPFDSYPKKNVRFADDFGLDLSQVKVITSDELPHVPSAAFKDLHISNDDNPLSQFQERMKTITYLEQKFENPIHAHGFDDRVSRHKVVLEQANAIDNRIYGTIKIVSLGLNKRVKIRSTTDNWITYDDHDATYITDSFDGNHDRFTFTVEINRDRIGVGNNIQFCIGYESYIGPEYWDNNYQQNYRFDCSSRTVPDYSD
ncbi:unnamed protein product [Adineta steineri]|uniref:CBM21 domain-containing protein n=1 Tax=Adineta steineri TaxID=433720 RepID=A0A814C8Z3_9BILA|nr:unnamed protein product [Adineta steineri]